MPSHRSRPRSLAYRIRRLERKLARLESTLPVSVPVPYPVPTPPPVFPYQPTLSMTATGTITQPYPATVTVNGLTGYTMFIDPTVSATTTTINTQQWHNNEGSGVQH